MRCSRGSFSSLFRTNGRYYLRACIVNFRTQSSDIDALIGIVLERGREIDARLRESFTLPA